MTEVLKSLIKLKILVCGKTGVGKSSLVNSSLLMEECKVGDPVLRDTEHSF